MNDLYTYLSTKPVENLNSFDLSDYINLILRIKMIKMRLCEILNGSHER